MAVATAAAVAPGSAERQARGGAASASGNAVSARFPPCRESAASARRGCWNLACVHVCVRLVPGSLLLWWWWVFCCFIGVGNFRGLDRAEGARMMNKPLRSGVDG
jgi:hypothetical protein